MSRGVWFVAGAGTGVYLAVRARRAAEVLTVDGLRDRVGAAVVGLRMFRDEVAQGKADAESGLREQLGLALDGHVARRELSPVPPPDGPDRAEPGPTGSPTTSHTTRTDHPGA